MSKCSAEAAERHRSIRMYINIHQEEEPDTVYMTADEGEKLIDDLALAIAKLRQLENQDGTDA